MKIYIAHATAFDFRSELYKPLQESALFRQHTFILPHETDALFDSREAIDDSDLVIADVSYPSTGLGIELGWASSMGKRIVAIHKTDAMPSSSIAVIAEDVRSYTPSTLTDIIKASLRGA